MSENLIAADAQEKPAVCVVPKTTGVTVSERRGGCSHVLPSGQVRQAAYFNKYGSPYAMDFYALITWSLCTWTLHHDKGKLVVSHIIICMGLGKFS
jgi:hypothetical protein